MPPSANQATPTGFLSRWQAKRQRRKVRNQLRHLRRLPRFETGVSDLTPIPMRYVDAASWAAQYDEIWRREIYRLPSPDSVRKVLDCGANIGSATLYFAQRFPNASIVSFEADPTVYQTLVHNCESWNVESATLHNSAVWTETTDCLRFSAEGADSGAVLDHSESSCHEVIEVTAMSLADQIDGPIDLLKMDIEGAELAVLKSCEPQLPLVKNLFVEYHSFTDRDQTLDDLLALLRRVGFRVHLDTPSVATQPFVEREPFNGMDQYLNVYAYRDSES